MVCKFLNSWIDDQTIDVLGLGILGKKNVLEWWDAELNFGPLVFREERMERQGGRRKETREEDERKREHQCERDT